jgi:hypothetical protein
MVIPCQVSSQFVAIKSQRPVHGLGLKAAVPDRALVGTVSAAHASPPRAAPAAVRIVAATMPSFVM